MEKDVVKVFRILKYNSLLAGIEPVFQQVDVDAGVLEDFKDDLHQLGPICLGLEVLLSVLQDPDEGQLEPVRVQGEARLSEAG